MPLLLATCTFIFFGNTKFVIFVSAMKISMEGQLARRVRIAAARTGKSVSKYLSEATREKVERDEQSEGRNLQLEAIEKILAGPKWDVTENGRMPTADERNARR